MPRSGVRRIKGGVDYYNLHIIPTAPSKLPTLSTIPHSELSSISQSSKGSKTLSHKKPNFKKYGTIPRGNLIECKSSSTSVINNIDVEAHGSKTSPGKALNRRDFIDPLRSSYEDPRSPYEDCRMPYEECRSPYKEHRPLYEEHRLPYEEHRSPYEELRSSYEEHRSPYEEHRSSYEEHRSPFKEHRLSYEEHGLPYEEHRLPYEDPRLQYEEHRSAYIESRSPYKEPRSPYKEPRSPYKETKSPYKSHHEDIRSGNKVSRCSNSPNTYKSILESRSSRSSSNLEISKHSKIRSKREHRSFYDKYYNSPRNRRNKQRTGELGDKKKDRNIYQWVNPKYKKNISNQLENEDWEDISETAGDGDFEELEVASADDVKESEVPVGFRKYKVKYLRRMKGTFFKPRIFYVCPERTVINCLNLEEDTHKAENGADEELDLDNEVMVVSEEVTEEDNEVISLEDNAKKDVTGIEKKTNNDTKLDSVSDSNRGKTKVNVLSIEALISSSRAYRRCIPEIDDSYEFYQAEAIIQEDLDEWNSHMIGLSYIIEVREKKDDTNVIKHHCALCAVDIHAENDSGEMVISHVTSFKHMFNYLEKHFPSCGFKFSERTKNYNNKFVLQKCCEEISNKLGHECMCITNDIYFLTNNEDVLKIINNMRHWNESNISIDAVPYLKNVQSDIFSDVSSLLNEIIKDMPEITVKPKVETKKFGNEKKLKNTNNVQSIPDQETIVKNDKNSKSGTLSKKFTGKEIKDSKFRFNKSDLMFSLFRFGCNKKKFVNHDYRTQNNQTNQKKNNMPAKNNNNIQIASDGALESKTPKIASEVKRVADKSLSTEKQASSTTHKKKDAPILGGPQSVSKIEKISMRASSGLKIDLSIQKQDEAMALKNQQSIKNKQQMTTLALPVQKVDPLINKQGDVVALKNKQSLLQQQVVSTPGPQSIQPLKKQINLQSHKIPVSKLSKKIIKPVPNNIVIQPDINVTSSTDSISTNKLLKNDSSDLAAYLKAKYSKPAVSKDVTKNKPVSSFFSSTSNQKTEPSVNKTILSVNKDESINPNVESVSANVSADEINQQSCISKEMTDSQLIVQVRIPEDVTISESSTKQKISLKVKNTKLKSHQKTTLHSKHCIKRILGRTSKTPKEASEKKEDSRSNSSEGFPRIKSPLRLHVSRSPIRRSARISPKRQSRSPVKRFRSPIQRHSRSPCRRRSRSPFRRQSKSPIRRYSRSPIRRQERSPVRRKSRSPLRRRSRSPIRRRSRSPLRSGHRKKSKSPLRRYSPIRRSISPHRKILSRNRSRSPVRRKPFEYTIRSHSPLRKRSRSLSSTRDSLSSRHNSIKSSDLSESYLKSSSKRYAHQSLTFESEKNVSDLDSISDEDESKYFGTREKPHHLEEIMKLPEPTRSVIVDMFKKFSSIPNNNPNDASLLKFMQFMNAHSTELQQIMGAQTPNFCNSSNVIPQNMNLSMGGIIQQQLPTNMTIHNQQFPQSGPSSGPVIQPVQNMMQNTFPPQQMQYQNPPPGFAPNVPPPVIPSHQPRPFVNAPSQLSNLAPNQPAFPQQNRLPPPKLSIAPEIVLKDLKARVNKLFGANEKGIKSALEKELSLRNTYKQTMSGPPGMSSGYVNEPRNLLPPNAPKFGVAPIPGHRFDADLRNLSGNTVERQENFPLKSNFATLYENENRIDPLSKQQMPVPPPDAKVSFCNAPDSATKRNLFPVVSSANVTPNYNPQSSQGMITDVKKSLAQRLAAVLVKVGMVDVPAPLLQEMLMKIGAFSSCPPQDIREGEILNILRRLGYVS